MSSNNPFGNAPQNPYNFQETPAALLPPEMQRGLVHHVPALGILTMVHGGLIAMLGVFMLGAAAMAPAIFQANNGFPARPGMQQPPPMPAEVQWFVIGIYATFGFVALTIGILSLFSGFRILKFRNRTFGIVTLSGGLLTGVSCICMPTAIGLLIYGLIVLLNPPVKRAFEMAANGATSADIRAHFAQLPTG